MQSDQMTVPIPVSHDFPYSIYHNHKILFLTYNIGGVTVTAVNRNEYIQQFHKLLYTYITEENNVDIIVIGLQEIVDLNQVGNIIYEHNEHIQWTELFNELLCPSNTNENNDNHQHNTYTEIAHQHMVGLYQSIYCKSQHHQHITNIHTQQISTGYRGLTGNKGSVSISFQLYNTHICCINVHLPAHQSYLNARNNDCHTILQ